MAQYFSKYSGQEIDELLGTVKQAVLKADVISDPEISIEDFGLNPVSFSLWMALKTEYDKFVEGSKDFVNTSGGEQSINGKKTFNADTFFNKNATVEGNINLKATATETNHGVNLGLLKKHGVSEEPVIQLSGLTAKTQDLGYFKLGIDFKNVASAETITAQNLESWNLWISDNQNPKNISLKDFVNSLVSSGGLMTQKSFDTYKETNDKAVGDLKTNKVDKETYNTKMSSIDRSLQGLEQDNETLNNVVETNKTNTDIAIGKKLDTTTFDTYKTNNDNSVLTLQQTQQTQGQTLTTQGQNITTLQQTQQTQGQTLTTQGQKITTLENYMNQETGTVSVNASATGVTLFSKKSKAIQFLVSAEGVTSGKIDMLFVYATSNNRSTIEKKIEDFTTGITVKTSVASGTITVKVDNAETEKLNVSYKIITAL